jgi:hypothetical protein
MNSDLETARRFALRHFPAGYAERCTTKTMKEILIFYLFAIIFGSNIIELIIAGYWWPEYYRNGIRIYYKKSQFLGTAPNNLDENVLSEAFKKKRAHSLIFKTIGDNEFAFREKIIQFIALSPAVRFMHGNIKIDYKAKTFELTGFLDWWVCVLIMILVVTLINKLEFLLPIILTAYVIYLFETSEYNQVARFVYEWNSRDWSNK